MKDIMARESSSHEQGVASFEYNQASQRQPFLFGLNRPIEELAESLLQAFAGHNITMLEIFSQNHVDTPFIKKNYKDALIFLESKSMVQVDPPAQKRQKRNGIVTFGDMVFVTFPAKNH